MFKTTSIVSLFILLQIVAFSFSDINDQATDSPILFIYDASGSKWGKINQEFKKEVASAVLIKTIDQLATDRTFATDSMTVSPGKESKKIFKVN